MFWLNLLVDKVIQAQTDCAGMPVFEKVAQFSNPIAPERF